jgi:cellulose biosynthesis protein BcsQ
MAKRIALFNHKGGVSKTTTTFNLGWMLALKGKRVIMVDADPQCNLTGLVLNEEEFEEFYENPNNGNLKTSLAPAFEAQPRLIEPANCLPLQDRVTGTEVTGLFLLPGHLQLFEYEIILGVAHELSSSLHTLKNLPGSFSYLFDKTAEKYQADYILIDLNPSLNSINQNLLMTSDYFLLPTSPDYFSVMAIKSLTTILPGWAMWAKKAMNNSTLTQATYPFPKVTPKFLGTIIQKYRLSTSSEGQLSRGFQNWIDQINELVSTKFIPAIEPTSENGKPLKFEKLTLPSQNYQKVLGEGKYCLAQFSDFNTLVALSQTHQTPIFALSDDQLSKPYSLLEPKFKYSGTVLDTMKESRDKFETVFSALADSIIELTR